MTCVPKVGIRNPDSETMVLDGEKREIPEHVADGTFGEQSYNTVQEAEKLVADCVERHVILHEYWYIEPLKYKRMTSVYIQ